jgi:hypothetical protein
MTGVSCVVRKSWGEYVSTWVRCGVSQVSVYTRVTCPAGHVFYLVTIKTITEGLFSSSSLIVCPETGLDTRASSVNHLIQRVKRT